MAEAAAGVDTVEVVVVKVAVAEVIAPEVGTAGTTVMEAVMGEVAVAEIVVVQLSRGRSSWCNSSN